MYGYKSWSEKNIDRHFFVFFVRLFCKTAAVTAEKMTSQLHDPLLLLVRAMPLSTRTVSNNALWLVNATESDSMEFTKSLQRFTNVWLIINVKCSRWNVPCVLAGKVSAVWHVYVVACLPRSSIYNLTRAVVKMTTIHRIQLVFRSYLSEKAWKTKM